jgi:hypothetical protein
MPRLTHNASREERGFISANEADRICYRETTIFELSANARRSRKNAAPC